MKRRDAIKLAAGGTIGAGLTRRVLAGEGAAELSDVFDDLGFDPLAPGNSFFVLVTDLHMADPTRIQLESVSLDTIDSRIIDRVNSMDPKPSMIVVAGDTATSSTFFSGRPSFPDDVVSTRWELQTGMAQLARFDQEIPLKMIPGNHESAPGVVDAPLWQAETGFPPYQTFELGGMRFILLNTGHSGDLDPVQQAWLEERVEEYSDAPEITVVMHHPLGSLTSGRGASRAIIDGFRNYSGDIWVLAGHSHAFSTTLFALENTTVISTSTTTASPRAFSDGKAPGFSVFCLEDGRMTHQIRCEVEKEIYRSDPFPDRVEDEATDLIIGFSEIDLLLLDAEEGFYDRDRHIVKMVAWDAGSFLSYVGNMVFRIPFEDHRGRGHRIHMMAGKHPSAEILYELSTDAGATYHEVEAMELVTDSALLTIDIPDELLSDDEYRVRVTSITNRYFSSFFFGGLAVQAAAERLLPVDDWRLEHFGTLLDEEQEEGVPVLHRYAFGLEPHGDQHTFDPDQPSALGLPTIVRSGGNVEFVFPRRRGTSGVGYKAQYANRLTSWWDFDPALESVEPIDDDWELVRFPIGPDGDRRFGRVEVVHQN